MHGRDKLWPFSQSRAKKEEIPESGFVLQLATCVVQSQQDMYKLHFQYVLSQDGKGTLLRFYRLGLAEYRAFWGLGLTFR